MGRAHQGRHPLGVPDHLKRQSGAERSVPVPYEDPYAVQTGIRKEGTLAQGRQGTESRFSHFTPPPGRGIEGVGVGHSQKGRLPRSFHSLAMTD